MIAEHCALRLTTAQARRCPWDPALMDSVHELDFQHLGQQPFLARKLKHENKFYRNQTS